MLTSVLCHLCVVIVHDFIVCCASYSTGNFYVHNHVYFTYVEAPVLLGVSVLPEVTLVQMGMILLYRVLSNDYFSYTHSDVAQLFYRMW